jgi:hypothetical protein
MEETFSLRLITFAVQQDKRFTQLDVPRVVHGELPDDEGAANDCKTRRTARATDTCGTGA